MLFLFTRKVYKQLLLKGEKAQQSVPLGQHSGRDWINPHFKSKKILLLNKNYFKLLIKIT